VLEHIELVRGHIELVVGHIELEQVVKHIELEQVVAHIELVEEHIGLVGEHIELVVRLGEHEPIVFRRLDIRLFLELFLRGRIQCIYLDILGEYIQLDVQLDNNQ